MLNSFICGDSLNVLKTMDANSIDLTVTSPPYDGLRLYNGYSFDFEAIAKELYRVTKPGGVVVWVVGDSTKNGSESGTSFSQALFFKDVCGFNLHDTMIYQKSNPLPQNHNRYEQCFEYMFVLSKGKPKTVNKILERCKTVGATYNYSKRNSAATSDPSSGMRNREEVYTTKAEKSRGNIWAYSVGINQSTKDKVAFQHPAIFPEKLAEDHILSWSNPGDVILDPFGGSGTTAKMSTLNDRNFIYIDISQEYTELAKQRIRCTKEQHLTLVEA